MKTYNVPENILQGIMEYLASRPYKEVAQGIQALGEIMREQATPVEQKKEDAPDNVI